MIEPFGKDRQQGLGARRGRGTRQQFGTKLTDRGLPHIGVVTRERRRQDRIDRRVGARGATRLPEPDGGREPHRLRRIGDERRQYRGSGRPRDGAPR